MRNAPEWRREKGRATSEEGQTDNMEEPKAEEKPELKVFCSDSLDWQAKTQWLTSTIFVAEVRETPDVP